MQVISFETSFEHASHQFEEDKKASKVNNQPFIIAEEDDNEEQPQYNNWQTTSVED